MKVALFVPCYVEQFYPRVAIATLELLERLGCQVEYPLEQTCCGQPMANAGFEEDAKQTYKHFVRTFEKFDHIVSPSGSCTYHVRKHYDILEQAPAVRAVRRKTLDLVEFLLNVLKVETLDARFEGRVGLHLSCHGLRGLRLGSGSERSTPWFSMIHDLLSMVEGVELVGLERPDECCGFGGTFAVNEPAISVKMGLDRLRDHLDNGARFVTGGDMSCLMHLDGIIQREGLDIEVIHIAEILNAGADQ